MLSADLTGAADLDLDLDLGGIFSGLGDALTHPDFGGVRFDVSGILGLVAAATPPDLAGVLTAATAARAQLSGATASCSLLGAALPGEIDRLLHLLDSMTGLIPGLDLPEEAGLDALLSQAAPVAEAIENVPLAYSSGSSRDGSRRGDRPSRRPTRRPGQPRPGARRPGGGQRAADQNDPDAVTALTPRILGFLQAIADVADTWSVGMGTGEAALVGLDLGGQARAQ